MSLSKWISDKWSLIKSVRIKIVHRDNDLVELFSKSSICSDTSSQYLEIFNNFYIISKTDTDGKITYVNDKFLKIHGLEESEVLGKTHKMIDGGVTPKKVYKKLWKTITKGKPWRDTLGYIDRRNKLRYALVNIFPIKDKNGEIVEYLALRQDITKLVIMEKRIEEVQLELIMSLGSVIESKNGELLGHIERVARYSFILAEAMGVSAKKANNIKVASPMHDAGKIGIPEELLNVRRKLTLEEFEIIKTHSTIGFNIFKNSKLDILKAASLIAYHHHEKWDGTGYPQGLKGEDISIEGRITAVADVYDALSTERTYKKAWSIEEIDAYFIEESGKSFDPKVIQCYFDNKELFNN